MEKFSGENPVRESALYVVRNAKDVRLNEGVIIEFAKNLAKNNFEIPSWPEEMHFVSGDSRKQLDYLIVLDALNFCFWSKDERWSVSYKGRRYNGYFALSLSLKKFFEEKPEKAEMGYLSRLSYSEFCEILGGGANLFFLRERWKILRGIAKVLTEQYGGDSRKFIAGAEKRLSNLIPKIAGELPSFDDTAVYSGKKIYLWKRTQILPMDIYGAFQGKEFGEFSDLDYATAFADYKLPQILRHFGILGYSGDLEERIKNKKLIPAGSKPEIEIRAATIWAVERLAEELRKLGKKIFPFQVDWILWNQSQEIIMPLPYHLTKTIFY